MGGSYRYGEDILAADAAIGSHSRPQQVIIFKQLLANWVIILR